MVLTDGKSLAAVQALSFEISQAEHLEKEVEATAWTIDDVKKEHPRLPLAVFVLPPRNGSPLYEKAQRVYRGLEAVILTGSEMGNWARTQADVLEI